MKTNEAPEKLYTDSSGNNPMPKRYWDSDIEYTRTDAFLEKAEKFLEANLTDKDCKFNWGDWTKVRSGETPITSFMREFRNYMKGE